MKFVSDDGMEFDSFEACKEHETEVESIKRENNMEKDCEPIRLLNYKIEEIYKYVDNLEHTVHELSEDFKKKYGVDYYEYDEEYYMTNDEEDFDCNECDCENGCHYCYCDENDKESCDKDCDCNEEEEYEKYKEYIERLLKLKFLLK